MLTAYKSISLKLKNVGIHCIANPILWHNYTICGRLTPLMCYPPSPLLIDFFGRISYAILVYRLAVSIRLSVAPSINVLVKISGLSKNSSIKRNTKLKATSNKLYRFMVTLTMTLVLWIFKFNLRESSLTLFSSILFQNVCLADNRKTIMWHQLMLWYRTTTRFNSLRMMKHIPLLLTASQHLLHESSVSNLSPGGASDLQSNSYCDLD